MQEFCYLGFNRALVALTSSYTMTPWHWHVGCQCLSEPCVLLNEPRLLLEVRWLRTEPLCLSDSLKSRAEAEMSEICVVRFVLVE